MIKNWSQFIREFINTSDSIIDARMQELKDLVDNITDESIVYEWENMDDHELTVSFSKGALSVKYDFDIDDLQITKTAGETIDFQTSVESIEEGLEIIEKDIQSIIGISEAYSSEWESSISYNKAEEVYNKISKLAKVEIMSNTSDPEGIVEGLEERLENYDKETIETVIDIVLYNPDAPKDWIIDEIISTGDKIMNRYGTEPMQVLNAFESALSFLRRHFDWEDEEDELYEARKKSARYRGRKIPGKYLAGPHPGKMKKEIDTYAGKSQYKKEWDADYKSGKGGEGKRVRTKKSAATKAYQRMFGKK